MIYSTRRVGAMTIGGNMAIPRIDEARERIFEMTGRDPDEPRTPCLNFARQIEEADTSAVRFNELREQLNRVLMASTLEEAQAIGKAALERFPEAPTFGSNPLRLIP